MSRTELQWWGWGEPAQPDSLNENSLSFLKQRLGLNGSISKPVELDQVQLKESKLPAQIREQIAAIVGSDGVRDDRLTRIQYAAGKSYPDLVNQRAGNCQDAPDAVVSPADDGQVEALLQLCAQAGIAVVPFGGGTSVVGGVSPLRERFESLIALDLSRITGVRSLDRESLVAGVGAGMRGPELEEALNKEGLTLGHFPQSYEFATIGGYVATRSAGQASTGYGRIDELVRGVKLIAPAGKLALDPLPATAAGPDIRQLVVGSEGVFGVITEADLEVRPLPTHRRYEGWFFKHFDAGATAFRQLEQDGLAPTVARLSDQQETEISLLAADRGRLKDRLARSYIRLRGYGGGCLAILGWEGSAHMVDQRYRDATIYLRKAGGMSLGESVGKSWLKGRFHGPYLRDELLDHGVLVETLETAAEWSQLMPLYRAVRAALERVLTERGTPPIVFCHISHLYSSGASLYFTFLAAQESGAEIEQWRAAKQAACEAIIKNGGTITHHHATGCDHAPWLSDEIGQLGVDAIRGVKEQLDPTGIMNPGKLLPN